MYLPFKVGDPNGAIRPPWVCVPVDGMESSPEATGL